MDAREALEAIGEPDGLEDVGRHWDESMAALGNSGRDFLQRDWILRARAFCGLDDHLDEALLHAAQRISRDEALLRLAWHCKWRLFDAEESPELRGWPSFEPSLGDDNGLFYLLVGLAMAAPTRGFHQVHGIPESVTRDTCLKVQSCCWMHEAGHGGRPGIQRQRISWLRHYVREPMFRIGSLEYWLKPSPVYPVVLRNKSSRTTVALSWDQARVAADGSMHTEVPAEDTWEATIRYNGDTITGYPISPVGRVLSAPVTLPLSTWERVVRFQDKVLQVHIPFGSSISIDAVRDSFRQAVPFFRAHFAHESPVAFASTSWLFSPLLHSLLGPDTNLTRFQRELYLYPIPSNNRSALSFIFPEDRFDPATASRKTRLQRRILDLMDQGGRWHIGGMFFLIDDLDCFGSQHYLSDTIPELARLGACGVVLAALPLHGRAVSVGKIGVGDARDLAVILGEDRALLESLGSRPDREPTAEGVLDRFEHWCNETNSISMAITETGGSCVGTISLSHIDLESSSAGIGYWITSTRWRQGLCSEAFDLVLSVARKLGLREVHANIETANVASRRIWLRRGAREEAVSEGKARYTILFDMSDRTDVPLGTA